MMLRGIIDRLDVTPEGEFIVIDYKTGRVPSEMQEHSRLGGVQFYALLCEQVLGRRPVSVRLLYLKDPVVIASDPSEQALRGLKQRTSAVWSAIERACEDEDFRPSPRVCVSGAIFRSSVPPSAAIRRWRRHRRRSRPRWQRWAPSSVVVMSWSAIDAFDARVDPVVGRGGGTRWPTDWPTAPPLSEITASSGS